MRHRPLLIPIVVTPPAAMPMDLATVKNFARVTTTDDDTLITSFIAAATDQAEQFTGLALITRTLLYRLDRFPHNHMAGPWWGGVVQGPISLLQGCAEPITLPCVPLQSVVSIVTYDQDDNPTTVDPSVYRVDTIGGRITLREGQSWPTSLRNADAIEITVTAGYGDDAAAVPQGICTAIMMQAQQMYDSKTACAMCAGPMALLQPFVVMRA